MRVNYFFRKKGTPHGLWVDVKCSRFMNSTRFRSLHLSYSVKPKEGKDKKGKEKKVRRTKHETQKEGEEKKRKNFQKILMEDKKKQTSTMKNEENIHDMILFTNK